MSFEDYWEANHADNPNSLLDRTEAEELWYDAQEAKEPTRSQ